MLLNESVGGYVQADLEKMTVEQLHAVVAMGERKFNEAIENMVADKPLPAFNFSWEKQAEYYELLAGAAQDLLFAVDGGPRCTHHPDTNCDGTCPEEQAYVAHCNEEYGAAGEQPERDHDDFNG